MPNDRVTLLHEWFEQVWNRGDVAAIDRLMAPAAIAHGLVGPDGNALPAGPAGFKPFFRQFRDAFPDIQVTVEDAVVEGDMIVTRCSVRGTHHGDTLGVAATMRPVQFTGMCMARVRNGQIVEGWNNFDFGTMNAQLGI
jgi:steroid delta-isomerase-like uncharacterized protein